jgi:thiol-disulfide isomerase/thioredoxin
MSVISAERFNSGKTYDQVRERVFQEGGKSKGMLEFGEQSANNAEIDVSEFAALDAPVNVLVLSEEWCPDCTDGLPIIDRIARETGKVNLRILPRDENIDLADQFLNKGEYRSIPTFIFLDDQFNVIGYVAERPDSVTEHRLARRKALHASRPELGGFETRPDELSDEVREARIKAEAALKAETVDWTVPQIASWLATPLKTAVAAD